MSNTIDPARSPGPAGSSDMPSISLLICTSGRPGLLDRALSAIESGTEKPQQLVVVNGIDGQTPDVVDRHADQFADVVLVEHPNRNLATLRNLGIPYLTSEVVAVTDDDAIADRDWIASIRRAYRERPGAAAMGGPVRGVTDGFLDRIAELVVFPDPKPPRPIHTLPTVNMSYRRSVMEQVGEFDEALFRGEDVDYNWRILQSGRQILFEPAMKVRHHNRSTLFGLYQQQYMYGRAYVLVRSKWPEMYSVYPHSLKTPRAWGKLAHAGLAILYQPLPLARRMSTTKERAMAYPVLVLHHLVWKLGMLRQGLASLGGKPAPAPKEMPKVTTWRGGQVV